MTARRRYGFLPAISIVVANMIGTGVFTSLGFQLLNIQSGFAILVLWAVGGLAAFCGAVCYAELGSALPRSGGEYHFLGRIIHPAAGFVSGWASSSVGFAAPSALAAMTFAAYALAPVSGSVPEGAAKALACALIIGLGTLHAWRRQISGSAQTVFTAIKIGVIVTFSLAVFWAGAGGDARLTPLPEDLGIIASGDFAVSLIYVTFAYTGWNAATYLTGEIRNPNRDLPLILAGGTFLVALLYVLLNAAFLSAAPIDVLSGKIEVGVIAAQGLFGAGAGSIISLVMAGLLVSTVSAMTIAGPRVLQVMGEDYPVLRALAKTNVDNIPTRAIILQSVVACGFVLTSSFESVLIFAGSLVALNSFMTVLALVVLRLREPDLSRPYRAFGFPFTPIIYLSVTGWALWFTLASRPLEALFVLGVIASGLALYALARIGKRT